MLFKNLGWKIGALLLSLALWFHIATEKTYEKPFPAKIEISRLSSSLKVTQIDPSKMEISFIGTGKQLLQLMLSRSVIINLDLSNISRPGEYDYNINLSEVSDVDVASFTSVTFINGNRIKIVVEPKS